MKQISATALRGGRFFVVERVAEIARRQLLRRVDRRTGVTRAENGERIGVCCFRSRSGEGALAAI